MTSQTNNEALSMLRTGAFTFSATKIERLGATEYTLVTVAVDLSSSVRDFADELLAMLKAAIRSCKHSPRSDNLLVRVITFSTAQPGGVAEVHGFMPLAEIDPEAYASLRPSGNTPLFDAAYSTVGATRTYAEELRKNDFFANAIGFIITDGWDNASSTTPGMIGHEIRTSVQTEDLESFVTVLIGVNVGMCRSELDSFKNEAGLTSFIDAGDASPRKLAKVAEFVSQSVSSQSQALGTGGPSQNIAAVI